MTPTLDQSPEDTGLICGCPRSQQELRRREHVTHGRVRLTETWTMYTSAAGRMRYWGDHHAREDEMVIEAREYDITGLEPTDWVDNYGWGRGEEPSYGVIVTITGRVLEGPAALKEDEDTDYRCDAFTMTLTQHREQDYHPVRITVRNHKEPGEPSWFAVMRPGMKVSVQVLGGKGLFEEDGHLRPDLEIDAYQVHLYPRTAGA